MNILKKIIAFFFFYNWLEVQEVEFGNMLKITKPIVLHKTKMLTLSNHGFQIQVTYKSQIIFEQSLMKLCLRGISEGPDQTAHAQFDLGLRCPLIESLSTAEQIDVRFCDFT